MDKFNNVTNTNKQEKRFHTSRWQHWLVEAGGKIENNVYNYVIYQQ